MKRAFAATVVTTVLATAGLALAKPKLKTVKIEGVTLGVPAGYEAAVAPRCIAMDGAGSLYIYKTAVSREDFDKEEAKTKGKRVAKDKDGVLCFERSEPGETARCMITTEASNWITQFVSFGKSYTKLGGAAAMKDIVSAIKGWDGKPYAGTMSEGSDCPVVK